MDIRYVSSPHEQQTNAVLERVAARAAAEGIVLAGTIQPSEPGMLYERCRIVLKLLPDGPVRDVSMDLGPGATGCRLDAGALEQSVLLVNERLPLAQALIVNKFGKQEVAGRGLVQAIGQACDRQMPVLIGVSAEWLPAFLEFSDGEAQPLDADADLVFDWLRGAILPHMERQSS